MAKILFDVFRAGGLGAHRVRLGASGQVEPYPNASTPVFCAWAPQTESVN